MREIQERVHEGWLIRESGPPGARYAVLLLPGALCSAAFYDDLLEQPKINGASMRFVATTLPGFCGTSPLPDLSVEAYAAGAGRLAAEFGCDAIIGHSMGANVAIEMVGAGLFAGPLVLLAPSLSRVDESVVPRALDRLARVFGHLPFSAMLKIIGPAMKSSLPADRRDALIAELQRNDPRVVRGLTHSYLSYLDRHGSVATRLCESGARSWLVFGGRDDVGLTDDERSVLDACSSATIVEIRAAGHFTLNETPDQVAGLLLDALATAGSV